MKNLTGKQKTAIRREIKAAIKSTETMAQAASVFKIGTRQLYNRMTTLKMKKPGRAGRSGRKLKSR